MKIRATLAALMITAAIGPSANATLYPFGIGPEGTKLRSEIIDKGFGCTKIKDATFTCTHKNKKVTLTARLIGGDWPTSGRLRSLHVVAHVRKATVGAVSLENCHPFVRELWGRYWVFAHNGDLKDFAPLLHGSFRPVGTTDSELAFCWMLQEMNKSHAGVPSEAELTHTLRDLAQRIATHGTFNFLLSNGQALWAHASTKLHYVLRQHPFSEVQLKDEDLSVDLSQLNCPEDRQAIVVTEPLTSNEAWVAMSSGELQVFIGGQPL